MTNSFPCPYLTDWGAAEEDAEDINVWEDNWDDDNIEDDFSEQLRWGGRENNYLLLGDQLLFIKSWIQLYIFG